MITAAAAESATTSMPVRTYQCTVLTAPGSADAATCSPAFWNDVVREPGWPVTPVGAAGKPTRL